MKQIPTDGPTAVYNKDYYDHYGSEAGVPYDRDQPVWQNHFRTFAQTLIERYHPRTTLDVGCAKGFLVEKLRDAGVEAFGLDVSPYAISEVREDIRQYCRVAHGTEPITGQFDLITCIEVAEHVPEPEARAMIAEMCRHTDQVIFSSTDSGFDEPTHINIHPAEYWIELFHQHGFFPDRNFQPEFITAQAIRFLRCTKNVLRVGVFSHEPPNCAVALLRLAGTIRHLERENRMQLQWATARDPQIDIENLVDSDVFIVHREFCDRRIGPPAIAAARAMGKPIVFELDDLLINVPKTNPNHKYCVEITPDVLAMLRDADFVTVTTDPLRKYLEEAEGQAKGKTFVLPNFINLDIWGGAKPPPENPEDPFVVGWFGTATHDEDLAIIKPAIVELAAKYRGKLVFKFWGYLPDDLKGIPGVQLMRGSQPDLRLHARDVIDSRIDLALAPLLDHPFNHAKSDLKWLEYSICYIPAIYSRISPYTGSIEHGRTGWLLDNNPKLWVEAIERFMHDHELRRSIAIQAHDEVLQKRSVGAGAEQWDALYRSFYISGPKMSKADGVSPSRDRAVAMLMQHSAGAFARNGDNAQAIQIFENAITKCLPASSAESMLVQNALQFYRQLIVKLKETSELTTLLNAAKKIAANGHSLAATQLYLEALDRAVKGNNPMTVLQVAIDVAAAFRTLDPAQGRRVLDMGEKLAKSIGSAPGSKTIETLRVQYGPNNSPPKTEKPQGPVSNGKVIATAVPNKSAFPLVSIITPVFNNLALTRGCLESLARTPEKVECEIIVIDNASSDGTSDYLKNQEQAGVVRVIANTANKGFAHACNQGAMAAKGTFLLFLNNDTRVTEGWLTALVRSAQHATAGVVGAKLLYADGTVQHAGIEFINGIPDHPHRYAPADLPAVNKRRELDMVTGACLLTPRDLFLSLGGFDEVFRNGVEDVDYCLRVRALGRKVIFEPESEVYHLEGQSIGRFDHANENLRIFFDRWSGAFESNFRFIVSSHPKTVRASESLLLDAEVAPAPAKARKRVVVSWEGSFLDYGSLSHVNRELVGLLQGASDLEIHRLPTDQNSRPTETDEQTGTPDITVRHAWPPNWARPVSGKLAVIQPWEFGSLPRQWVKQATDVDEFWVPSQYVRNVYIGSGVPADKVFAVPNGVDGEKFRPQVAPMKLPTRKKFKFLFVGGTIGRKGPDLLLQGYLKQFTDADEVCLVIKDFGGAGVYAGQTFETQIQAAQSVAGAPEILYLNDEFPPDSLPGLYTACDCLVLPYRGEGFGLPVLEAMACGLPVIVTAGGATDDFVRDEFGWRIPANRKVFGREVSGMPLAEDGWLLEPDVIALGEAMRAAFTNPADSRERGRLAGIEARENWSWKKSAAIVAERIRCLSSAGDKQAKDSRRRRNDTTSPPAVALIGRLNEARELSGRKKFEAAWNETLAALARRPYHPEAYLLLAEIAAGTGDAETATQCAQYACALAPAWSAAKQFLNKAARVSKRSATKHDGKRPDWVKLPDAILNQKTRRQTLSVCLITKNEEKFLGQCLKSIRGFAQQLIVVDTGSTDRTIEIAKEFGAEIYSHKWVDDFSAARNAALERAKCDWVLVLDADEELPPAQHSKLQAEIQKGGVMAYRLPLVNVGQEAEGQSFVPRLFRNVPGAFYFERIHEQIFPSLLPPCKSWGLTMSLGSAQILHHGYSKETMPGKVARNLPLLRRACEENPDDVNLAMNLGLELVRSEHLAEGLEKYREAFRLMSELPQAEVAPELREVLLTQFTSQLYKVRKHEEVVGVLNSPATKIGGLTASLHMALGLSCFELGNYPEAAEHMRHCLAKRHRPALSPINTDILTAMPNHCLALALARSKDTVGAEKAFQAALSEPGRAESIKLDYAKFLADTNRPVEALQKLHEMVSANCRNAVLWRAGGEIALSRPDFLRFALDWTGEAMRYAGEDPAVIALRAEALMLSGDTAAAAKLWEQTWSREPHPRSFAALILCETIESENTHAPDDVSREISASREFVAWYQRLIAMRAKTVANAVNAQLDRLSRVLPNAAKKIETALAGTVRNQCVTSG
ncbi:MAG TPA: glycosyltransferase [Verrucomicrobiae bacterium]|nr:glycosyltransferase [Verrucomicrobiae bacterium]